VLDVVVTGLFAIAIPALLWLTWRRNADDATDDSHLSFRDWDHAPGLRGEIRLAESGRIPRCHHADRSATPTRQFETIAIVKRVGR